MKKLLVLVLVLSMATIANAALKISVDGVADAPDTTITLAPSDTATIGIWGDGQSAAPYSLYLLTMGAGTMSGGGIVMPNTNTTLSEFTWHNSDAYTNMLTAGGFITTNAVYVNAVSSLIPIPNYDGTIVGGVVFHCDGAPGDVTLALVHVMLGEDPDTGDPINIFETLDTQVIHQIPEPMTMCLLGLGGLFLRRRSS